MRVEAASAQDAFAVTPSDDTVVRADALYVGTAGDVTVITARGTTVEFVGAQAGSVIPITCTKVMAATTASDIVGLKY